MKKIHNAEDLKRRITELESEKIVTEHALKSQFHETYESFKPVNIIRNTVKEVTSTPKFKQNLFNIALGLGAGMLSKKLVVGKGAGLLKRSLATALQYGVTALVARSKANEKETDHKKGNVVSRILSGK